MQTPTGGLQSRWVAAAAAAVTELRVDFSNACIEVADTTAATRLLRSSVLL